jgi:hypothetical protein
LRQQLAVFLSDLMLESVSREERRAFACLSLLGIFGVTLGEVQMVSTISLAS